MSAVLEVRDLHVSYKSSNGLVPAVRGVDLEIAPGETLGLAGESGCGKSTLAMALLRLVPPTTQITGSIKLAGQDILTMKPGQLRAARWAQASVVFQGAQHVLNPVRRIGRQIDEAIEAHGSASASRAGELLDLVGLGARRGDDYPHELSGGEQQRVVIARALLNNPEVILADEPTGNLDPETSDEIMQLLIQIAKDYGTAVIMATHDFIVINRYPSRILKTEGGKVLDSGAL